MLNAKIAQATKGEQKLMAYKSFGCDVEDKFHLTIHGWPLDTITNPSDIKNVPQLAKVHEALKDGRCFFHKMTMAELQHRVTRRLKETKSKENVVGLLPTTRDTHPIGEATSSCGTDINLSGVKPNLDLLHVVGPQPRKCAQLAPPPAGTQPKPTTLDLMVFLPQPLQALDVNVLNVDASLWDLMFEPPRLPIADIVDNLPAAAKNATERQVPVTDLEKLPSLFQEVKAIRQEIASVNSERNRLADRIKSLSKDKSEAGSEEKTLAIAQARTLRETGQRLNDEHEQRQKELQQIALSIPNWSHKDVPIGGYDCIKEISHGGPEPINLDGNREHTKIAADLGLLDLPSGSKVTGYSWYYLLREAVALEQALVNYALSVASSNGWTMVTTPDVIKADLAQRCGFQPREDEAGQTYFVESSSARAKRKEREEVSSHRGGIMPDSSAAEAEREALVLAGTAEIPLAGLFAFNTYNKDDLPMTVVGLGKAFRAEAGARGAQTRGIYRVHQFTKVELFSVTASDSSEQMMETMLSLQRQIIDGLNIPYRVLDMPTEELGASAWRKYDIEAWMPGRGEWGEICSLSNCTDYQSRRLNVDYLLSKDTESPETEDPQQGKQSNKQFSHTLNGTAAAVPRLIIALLENGAVFKDGKAVTLRLPESLRKYWIGPEERIRWVEKGQGLSLS
ncbi:seryl-tRNA synthetase [Dacryopinax primogenitus]|uniref:serine--tRNA ligase n=1 Tax=Dacryopinax primogenitus (strain DJM 731) TaxID=1858805 RepID=M5G2B0_DACPD|nr:seryl-tRNA synthetase [Dacryopinax primogenitus]EJU00007.1 seryl-tRNA synthetase [Dacryopinax primogenitus]